MRSLRALVIAAICLVSFAANAGSGKWPGGSSGGGGAVSSVTGTSGVSCSPTTGAVSCSASAVPLSSLATQAANTFTMNATGGTAVPTAAIAATALSVIRTQTCTKVTVGSAVQDLSFTTAGSGAIAGDADGLYTGYFRVPATAAGVISLQPNAISTGQESRGYFYTSGTNILGNVTAFLAIDPEANSEAHGSFRFFARSAQGQRHFYSEWYDGTLHYTGSYTGAWTDTSTVVTSINIHSSVASGIPIGAWFVICKEFIP